MSFLAIASALMPAITSIIDKAIPDPEASARAKLEVAKLQQEGAFKELEAQLQLNLAQAEINKIEAASRSPFQGGWRPGAGWVGVAAMAYEFLVRPLLPWCLTVSGAADVPPLPSLDNVLFEMVGLMLGLGGLRTLDKRRRIDAMK